MSRPQSTGSRIRPLTYAVLACLWLFPHHGNKYSHHAIGLLRIGSPDWYQHLITLHFNSHKYTLSTFVSFPHPVIKHCDKVSWREKGFVLAHGLRLPPFPAVKTQQQELEGAALITASQESVLLVVSTLSFYTVQDPCSGKGLTHINVG